MSPISFSSTDAAPVKAKAKVKASATAQALRKATKPKDTRPLTSQPDTTTTATLAELQAMPVHPIAAMFPMLGDEELAELADDIAANGVNHAVVISRDGMLIDGRNRLAACSMVKVNPPVTYFDGDDDAVRSFILSENVSRRHLSKSQRAMAVAKAFPDPAKYRRGGANLLGSEGLSASMISMARTVLRLAPTLVDPILAGAKTVEAAYSEARLREGDDRADEMRLRKLRTEAKRPDLVEAVTSGVMTIDEALRKAKADADELASQRWAATKNICEGVMMLERRVEHAADVAAMYDPALATKLGQVVTADRLRDVSAFAAALADIFAAEEA